MLLYRQAATATSGGLEKTSAARPLRPASPEPRAEVRNEAVEGSSPHSARAAGDSLSAAPR